MLSFVITYWVEILFSLIASYIAFVFRKIKKQIETIKYLDEAACLNLKMHILEKYKTIKEKGHITIDDKEEILTLYNLYKKLDCSNVFVDIFNELNDMPTL